MTSRAFVTGTGVITAIGNSVAESLSSLQNNATGIAKLSLFQSIHSDLPVGEVKLSSETLASKLAVPALYPRSVLLGIHAAKEAIQNSGLKNIQRWKTGLISATTVGGMDKGERFYENFLSGPSRGRLRDIVYHASGSTTNLIAKDLGITGFTTTINTACSSSVNSIILGTRLIQSGKLDVVIAGGTDALTRFTLNGFNSLMILDNKRCRPFDAQRHGLNLGEGAGFLVLVSDKVLEAEGLHANGSVSGFGNTNDAWHQTASSPEGRGSYKAMDSALKMSHLLTGEIDYINVHGTGTINNDLSEGTAIKRLFGESIPAFSSTKGLTGHTLGASGGIEAVFSMLAISERCTFASSGFDTTMPELSIVPEKDFRSGIDVRHVMSNSFGFGGNCSSIIFSKN